MMRRKRRGMMPEAKFLSDLHEHERHDPGDKHLKAQAIKFERENSPKDYRQMRDAGELDEYAGLKARATRSFAQTLISQGELPSHACGFTSSNETRIERHRVCPWFILVLSCEDARIMLVC